MARSSGPLSTTSAHMIAIRLKKTHRQIFGALLSLSSAALLIRVMGMVNQIIVTSRFGAGATMDAYFVASSLPTLLASLSGSAIEASVIPIYARVRTEGKEQASILVSTLLNIFLLAAVLVTIIMLIFRRQFIFLSAPALDPFRAGLAASLAPVIFPSLILLLIISLLECILNTEGQFGWPAYAGMLVPLTTAVFVLLLGKTNGVVILCVGTLVGLCLQVCAVFVRTRRAGLSYHFTVNLNNPALGAILIAAWPVFLGALISQASPLVDQIFASYLSAGSISALSYALKLIGVPTGVIFVAVGRAVLPYLSRQASANDMKAFKHTLRLYLWMVGGGTILLTCFMLVLAHPIVRILFQHGAFTAEDTDRTAVTLVGFVVGLTPMALGFITARAFSALGKTRVLMGVTMFSVVANAVFDYIFARFWQSAGIALSTSAVYFCTMFILFFILQRMIGDLKLLTPPQEVLDLASRIGLEEGYMRVVEWWNHGQGSLFGIPYRMRMQIIRLGMILAVFAVGIFGLVQNTLYTVRAALGSLIVLALLRYHPALAALFPGEADVPACASSGLPVDLLRVGGTRHWDLSSRAERVHDWLAALARLRRCGSAGDQCTDDRAPPDIAHRCDSLCLIAPCSVWHLWLSDEAKWGDRHCNRSLPQRLDLWTGTAHVRFLPFPGHPACDLPYLHASRHQTCCWLAGHFPFAGSTCSDLHTSHVYQRWRQYSYSDPLPALCSHEDQHARWHPGGGYCCRPRLKPG